MMRQASLAHATVEVQLFLPLRLDHRVRTRGSQSIHGFVLIQSLERFLFLAQKNKGFE